MEELNKSLIWRWRDLFSGCVFSIAAFIGLQNNASEDFTILTDILMMLILLIPEAIVASVLTKRGEGGDLVGTKRILFVAWILLGTVVLSIFAVFALSRPFGPSVIHALAATSLGAWVCYYSRAVSNNASWLSMVFSVGLPLLAFLTMFAFGKPGLWREETQFLNILLCVQIIGIVLALIGLAGARGKNQKPVMTRSIVALILGLLSAGFILLGRFGGSFGG